MSEPTTQTETIICGFEDHKKYFDHALNAMVVKISPGEYYITDQKEVITTVLGSCISACIRDVRMNIGGMNHFMIPVKLDHANAPKQLSDTRYGISAMEHLINDILKHGGSRNSLEIKLFGAANVLHGSGSVGMKNIKFIYDFIEEQGYRIASESLGGGYSRKINYCPITGKVMLKKLASTSLAVVNSQEHKLQKQIESASKPD